MADLNNERREVLLHEYGSLPGLIAHWDSHFWHKSQFFFTVESVMLGGVAIVFRETFLKRLPLEPQEFRILLGLSAFNYWICYVWYRTNRSNREFIGPLFDRARAIEAQLLGDFQRGTFSNQWASLRAHGRDRHSSHWWENHLPSVLAAAWTSALLMATSFSQSGNDEWWAWSTVFVASASVALTEAIHPRRSARHNGAAPNSDQSSDRQDQRSPRSSRKAKHDR